MGIKQAGFSTMLTKIGIGLGAFGICLSAMSANAADWLRAESEHFIFYSNNKLEITKKYVSDLERYRQVLATLHPALDNKDAPTAKLEIWFVRDFNDFDEIMPGMEGNVLGFIAPNSNGMHGYSIYKAYDETDKDAYKKLDIDVKENGQVVMFHEFSHAFMSQNTSFAFPLWFSEGYADFYGTVKIEGNKATVGKSNIMRAFQIKNSVPISWSDLIAEKEYIRKNMRDFSALYAQGWLLTHYILTSEERKANFAKYLEARNKGEDKLKAFEATMGISPSELGRVLQIYFDKQMKTGVLSFENQPEIKMNISAMPKSADKLALWDGAVNALTYHGEKGQAKLLKNIKDEAEKYPNDEYAQSVLARANIIVGPEEKALSYYEGLVEKNPNDGEAWFRLGQTMFLMHEHKKVIEGFTLAEQKQQARNAFLKAYQLNPLNAANLFFLSYTGVLKDEKADENSFNAALEAFYLQPGVSTFASRAAVLAIRNEKYEIAIPILQSVASNPHAGKSGERLQKAVDALKEKKPKMDVLNIIYKDKIPKDDAFDPQEDDDDDGDKGDKKEKKKE